MRREYMVVARTFLIAGWVGVPVMLLAPRPFSLIAMIHTASAFATAALAMFIGSRGAE